MDDNFANCSLPELIADPLIGLLMKSDGVDRRSVELIFERVARERERSVPESRSFPPHEEAAECSTC
jgi:hypothetical protein